MSVGQFVKVARIAPFAVVVLAPVLASWHLLTGLGQNWGLSPLMSAIVPLVLDAAALGVATLAWQATLDRDADGVDRLLVWVYASASSALNAWWAAETLSIPAALFFGACGLSAATLYERMLRNARRPELREIGSIDKPTPRFRILRWVLFPIETAGAFRFAVGKSISDPRVALDQYQRRNDPASEVAAVQQTTASIPAAADGSTSKPALAKAPKPAPTKKSTPATESHTASAPQVSAPELVGLKTKRAKIIRAFDAIGDLDGQAAIEWLAERGVSVDKSGTYRIARELRAADEAEAEDTTESTSPHLVAVGGDDR